MRLAACQYPIDLLPSWDAYEAKISAMAAAAAGRGAELLVFPEYGSMELASLFPEAVRADLAAQLDAMQALLPPFLDLHRRLARGHGVHILAATFPVRLPDGSCRNRAHLLGPEGPGEFQDKLVMTRFEDEQWRISAGDEIKVFDTRLGRLGVCVCYDAEFPLIARAQVEAGAQVLLVPSCTDTWHGHHRVRIGARARALENQCVTVQAPTVGEAPWSPAVDVNVGQAGVFAPVDRGFPADGVLALGDGTPGWVHAEADLEALAQVRRSGQVLNHRDWDRQWPATRHPARVVRA